MRRSGSLVLLGVLACVALLAWFAREANNVRIPATAGTGAEAGWFSPDPDSAYHMRRLERLLDEGLPVAERDPLLNTPHGARIPWPPYYTLVLGGLLGPLAPSDPAPRRAFIECGVATLPLLFGVLSALCVAAAAWRLAGAGAAWIAGGTFALLRASIDYSAPGVGDHHAWATLCMAALFALVATGLGVAGRERGTWIGVVAGLVAGVLLGSWVGGLVHVLIVQAALGLALVVHTRRPLPALPAFGLAFHLALAAAIAPAVLASPWREDLPWMVVNLSWFHLALPLLGAAVFVYPLARAATPRGYPVVVAAVIVLLGVLTFTTDLPFARGVREGFAWAGGANLFMAYITESQPLLWGQIGGAGVVSQVLGWGAWLALPLWAWSCVRAWRAGRTSFLVWAIALPVMLVQAVVQRRFAEASGVPLAVVLGVGLASLAAADGPRWATRLRTAPALGLACCALVPLALQWPTVQATTQRLARGETELAGPVVADVRSLRALYEWLGNHAAQHARDDRGVLAAWDQGHAIEWVAGLPTVATNFGSYVGEDSYLDPMRFFLAEDPARGEALLDARDARFVVVTGAFTKDLEVMLRLLRPGRSGEYVAVPPGQGPRPTPRWYRTLAARLMLTGKVGDPERGTLDGDSLDFLRLVHVSPEPLRTPPPIPHTPGAIPAGWIWERVAGARVTAQGAPGERFEVALDVEYAATGGRLRWSRATTLGADGTAALRVPYASDAANGDGRVAGPVHWSVGARSGTDVVTERAVLAGGEVAVR